MSIKEFYKSLNSGTKCMLKGAGIAIVIIIGLNILASFF